MEESIASLDSEYKRYLQILRPYLGQLVDEDAIKLCNAWIQRLSSCSDNEKSMRNKYIFVLCYQLAKGILEEPFIQFPSKSELPAINEINDSATSSEEEYMVIDRSDTNTKVLYNNDRPTSSGSEHTKDIENTDSSKPSICNLTEVKSSQATRKQTILCYTCPEVTKNCVTECSDFCSHIGGQDEYEYRANNLILRLREIKKQNMLLHKELIALKAEAKQRSSCESLPKVNTATSTYLCAESSATVKSIKNKLQSVEEDKENLLHALDSLQEQFDNLEENKRHEIEDIQAKHKIEITKLKSSLRDENKIIYEEKVEQLKDYYEQLIRDIRDSSSTDIQNTKKYQNEIISEKEKIIQEKDRQILEITRQLKEIKEDNEKKSRDLQEKNRILQNKDTEIQTLKVKLEEEKSNFHSILNKFVNKPAEDSCGDRYKLRAQELEKRLIKMEKSKSKCMKAYEAKLACIQREKHVAECSLQLQLVRQRAQVINEIADENQGELNTALDKLEVKYKEIVANVQSTAIERRMQDELTINAIVKAACACNFRNEVNYSQFLGKPNSVHHDNNDDIEISGVVHKITNPNKSYEEEGFRGGYCLNGEKFGELLEKVYIPQRDHEMPHKK